MTTPLILVPGLGSPPEMWHYQVHHLKEVCPIQVISLEHQDSQQAMAEEVLKHAPTRFNLAGQSMGGWVAQKVASMAPERVNRLMLLNTWCLPSEDDNSREKLGVQIIENGEIETALDTRLSEIIYPSRLEDKALIDEVRKFQRFFTPEVYLRHLKAMIADYSSIDLLKNITAPTLIIASNHDGLFAMKEAETLEKMIKHSALTMIEECGHISILERPYAVSSLIRLWITLPLSKLANN